MSWEDRDRADDPTRRFGRPGGDWQGLRPTFDNPMTWSIPCGRIAGVDLRVHLVFLIYVVVELARSLGPAHAEDLRARGFGLAALDLGALFLIVLLHEFGHVIACRRTGGEADEILMWPLGGLAYCRPPTAWKAHLVTAVGGPLVNVAIFAALAVPLLALTGEFWGVALPNPLRYPPLGALRSETVPMWAMHGLYAVQSMNVVVLLFNLLPVFPLDGGRITQALAWSRMGYAPSMRLAVHVGYLGAIGLLVFGAVTRHWMLVAIAAFGGITCYITLKQLEWTDAVMIGDTPTEPEERTPTREERRETKAAIAAEEEAKEIDRILAKIAEDGMEGLTGRERRTLKRATERKRQDQA